MTTIHLPIFGEVTLEEETWEYKYEARIWEYSFEKYKIDLDVHFIRPEEPFISHISKGLENLDQLHQIALQKIQEDYKTGTIVKEYLNEWVDDLLEPEVIEQLIKKTDSKKSIKERLFETLRIVRIGFYAESEHFVVLDFAFGYDGLHEFGFREDMIVVSLDKNWRAVDITTEG